MPKNSPPKLPDVSQRILLLVDLIGGGSQRGFAKIVGCSHAAIAKIAKGQQEPGKDILARISQAPQVNETWLMTGEGEALVPQTANEDKRIPVAESLLPGLPSDHPHLLSSQYQLVPASIYKDTLYAVDAVACVPAYNDIDEHFLPGDRVVIDADPRRWIGNFQSLRDKLCVTMLERGEDAIITLRRVQVSYASGPKGWSISACHDDKFEEWIKLKMEMRQDLEDHGKYRRVISLGPASLLSKSEQYFKAIPSSAIVGKAIRLVREL